jgi:hypothetical protein
MPVYAAAYAAACRRLLRVLFAVDARKRDMRERHFAAARLIIAIFFADA